MLEAEMKKLTAAVEALTAALQKQKAELQDAPKAETKAPEAVAPKAETIDRDQLQDLCLSLVRTDRKNKPRIMEVIAAHGGKILNDVADANLAQLKADLEAL